MPSFGELLGSEICEAREALGWTQLVLAEKAFEEENPDTWDQYVRRIGDYENGRVKRPQVKVYQPLCDVLGITRRRIGELKAKAADAKSVSDYDIAALRAEKGSLEQALSDLRTLSRSQLETLAGRFEYARAYDATDGALIEFLTEKARDYRALKAEVNAIEDGLKRLSNLKSAARAAIDAGDLDEVEEILSRVQEVELDEAAKTAELRANNALLRGRTEQAFRILSAAADSFAAIDPIEPARKRILSYFAILRGHGLRYGGTGIQFSIDMLTECLTAELRQANAWLWAAGQNWLAVGKSNQGSRADGPTGTRLLAQAKVASGKALEVFTRDTFPLDWAIAQTNLATTLEIQGSRTNGPEGASLLAQAVATFRNALEVYSPDAYPMDWALIQNNLAIALHDQGRRTVGSAGADLIAQSVAAHRAALKVRTRDAFPVLWAETQNNLATALQDQGVRTDDLAGAADLLAQAAAACRDALLVFTPDAFPVDWAITQNNLGSALKIQGRRTNGPAGAHLLAQAVDAYSKALDVLTRDSHAVQWAKTQNNLTLAQAARAGHDSCTEPRVHLEAALTHVTAALEVFDPEHTSYEFGQCTELKTRIEAKLAALDTP
ncbi:MAG: hypothetical protein CML68_17170 [Rhodobacteraceae bacterium]|nr:hypothetical protein [Paracoccaceae bacterium]